MNEKEIYDAEFEENLEEKEEILPEKAEKKPLRKRIGEKLISDEPLISKKVKRGFAIATGLLATGAAVAVAWIAGHGEEAIDALPEGTTELLTDGDPPFDTETVTDTVENLAE